MSCKSILGLSINMQTYFRTRQIVFENFISQKT
jgi:hypothetical protein